MHNIEDKSVLSLWEIIDDINQSLFLHPNKKKAEAITDILEITYKYQENWWNETLFSDFSWCDSQQDFKEVYSVTSKALQKYIEWIDQYLSQLNIWEKNQENYDSSEKSSNSEHIRHGLLKGSLEFASRIFTLTLVWLPFEIQKAWWDIVLDEKDIQWRMKILQELEEKNFWGEVSDNPKEVEMCYEMLIDNYIEGKNKLSHKQKVIFKYYIARIEDLLPKEYSYRKKRKIQWKNSKRGTRISARMQDVLATKIPLGDGEISWYAEIFWTILNHLHSLDFDIKIERGFSSLYDGPGYIWIPKNPKYEELTVRRILSMIWHEIECHSVNYRTSQKFLWNFRGAWSVEKEEALAILSEKLLYGNETLENIGITSHFPKVLLSELLTGPELEEFLEVLEVLSPDTTTVKKRVLRLKRNYPYNFPGSQHKDTSYSRGILKMKDFLLSWGDIRDFFVGKVWIDDIPKMKRLLELEWVSLQEYIPNIWVSEILLYHLTPISERQYSNFLIYLKHKYPFVDFSENEVWLNTASIKILVDILFQLKQLNHTRIINTKEKLGINTDRIHIWK